MPDSFNKIKIWFKDLTKKHIVYVRRGIEPGRDWLRILIGLFLGLCLSGVTAFYFYVRITEGTLFVVPIEDVTEQIHIDTKLLKKTIDDITIRRGAAELFRQTNMNFPDPSF